MATNVILDYDWLKFYNSSPKKLQVQTILDVVKIMYNVTNHFFLHIFFNILEIIFFFTPMKINILQTSFNQLLIDLSSSHLPVKYMALTDTKTCFFLQEIKIFIFALWLFVKDHLINYPWFNWYWESCLTNWKKKLFHCLNTIVFVYRWILLLDI
jgi:hypothetical protein